MLCAQLRIVLVTALIFSTGGCSTVFYSKTKAGKFSGRLYVEWVAPNSFIYRPDPNDPLYFETPDGKRIEPQLMYTDGGSIPRLFWSAPSFGPWDFAPGYIVHDWLFEQHHCKTGDWESMSFDSSARILSQAMKTQMEKAGKPEPIVVYSVYQAVHSPIAASLWDSGKCSPPPPFKAPGAINPQPSNDLRSIRILTIDAN